MIEDSKGVFEKEIMDTYTGIKKRYMCNGIFEKLLLKTNICPGVYGVSKCCRDIRVSSMEGLLINQYTKNKFIEEKEQELFDSLTVEQINRIVKMFADNMDLSNINDAVLVLTSPLVKDGLADNYDEQEYVYREIIKDYLGKKLVVIKPHPRDDFKYMDIFESSQVIQLERSFPSEILNYIGNNCFSEYITINSHSIYSFPNDKIIYLGLDYLNNKLEEYRKSKK